MSLYELIHEFLFDCKVRELSELTVHNYEKQLNKFRHFVRENFQVIEFEELKPMHVMLMMLFDTGLRISEIMDMKPQQIRAGYFVVYGKGRKERVVPQSAIVSKWIMKYERIREFYFEYREAEDYYFLSKNGKHLTPEAVNKFMKKAAKAVGVSPLVRVSPHTCRHTFAHQELKNGLDLYSLSRLLGHESVSITQRYLEGLRDEQILTSARKTGVLANL